MLRNAGFRQANNVLNFTGQESTVASSSILDKAWMTDLAGQWNSEVSETAVYWDSISVTSVTSVVPEPAALGLLCVGGLVFWARTRGSRV